MPMITSTMLKYDPINHRIWIDEPVPAPPVVTEARRVLTGLAAAAIAARLALVTAARVVRL